MSAPTVGSLFAGIGGFDLGFGAAGYDVRWTVELADFPDEVLAARFPDVERLRDVREVVGPPAVDVLTGGFPCQDLSAAGKGTGIGGERSGLWTEYARIIGDVRPQVVVVENVPLLLRRGMEVVIHDLVELGYAVEWDCIPAAAFGAPHLRDRVWLVAHRQGDGQAHVFGEATGLFPHDWHGLAKTDAGWLRWPRAGVVVGTDLYDLEPLAPVASVKHGTMAPTPQASDGLGGRNELGALGRAEGDDPRTLQRPSGAKAALSLGTYAHGIEQGRFPTPIARDWKGAGLPGQLGTVAAGGLWRTPTAEGYDSTRDGGENGAPSLLTEAQTGTPGRAPDATREADEEDDALRLWPTPRATPGGPDYARADRERSGGDDLATAVARQTPGQLNPTWVEWLMGFPLGWTDPAIATDALVDHPWESGEPPDVPRVTTVYNRRRERLTALGNALVPRAAVWLGARVSPLLRK